MFKDGACGAGSVANLDSGVGMGTEMGNAASSV